MKNLQKFFIASASGDSTAPHQKGTGVITFLEPSPAVCDGCKPDSVRPGCPRPERPIGTTSRSGMKAAIGSACRASDRDVLQPSNKKYPCAGLTFFPDLRFLNIEIFADFFRKEIRDFVVTRDCRATGLRLIGPPGMIATLPDKNASVCVKMTQKLASLHTESSSSV